METGSNRLKKIQAQVVKQRSRLANICSPMYGEDEFSTIIEGIIWDG
jgi:hypothetical protein